MRWIRFALAFAILSGTCMELKGQRTQPPNIPLSDFIPFHFGYSVGYTFGNFSIQTNNPEINATVVGPIFGFELQLLANKRINKNLTFRILPGIGFVSRSIEMDNLLSGESDVKLDLTSIFIGSPILFKYKSDRLGNVGPYLIAGVNPRWDLAAGIRKQGLKWDKALTGFNQYVEVGTGVDFFFPTARMGLEFKYSVGLLNDKLSNIEDALVTGTLGPYAEYIDRLIPSIFIISLIVEQ